MATLKKTLLVEVMFGDTGENEELQRFSVEAPIDFLSPESIKEFLSVLNLRLLDEFNHLVEEVREDNPS